MSSSRVSQFPVEVPWIRTQVDGRQEEFSFAARTLTPAGDRDLARQEFKDETDVRFLIEKYRVGGVPPLSGGSNGVMDYTQDLNQVMQVRMVLHDFWAAVRPELKAKYGTLEDLLQAHARGEWPPKPAEPPAAAAGGSAGSPSDSAAVTPPKAG